MDWAAIFSFVAILLLFFSAGLFRFKVKTWTALIGAGLFVITILNHMPVRGMIFFWLVYLAATCFANLHIFRRRYFTKPLLKRIQKQLPSISHTEQEAIDAGDTWWEKDLFCGKPDWQQLYQIKKPELSSEEQEFLDTKVEKLCQMCDDWKIVHQDADLPQEVWDYIKKEKFFGLIIPKEYGGLHFSALAHSSVVTKIATRSISAAVDVMVPNSLGPAELLLRYGTDQQKEYYLPRLAVGEEIPCFALTGPHAASDAGSMPDRAIVCKSEYNGKEVVGLRLSWDKRYITLAPIATVLGLAVHMFDPDHLLGEKEDIGITLCLIPTSHPGVNIGNRHMPMQMAFMNGPTTGKDVFIPLDWIIGGKEMAGNGWRMLMECLSIGRSLSLPALASASSKVAYRYTGAYARVRRQFNMPIAYFEGVEAVLGEIAGNTYTMEAARIMTAGAVDLGINPSIASAIAKYNLTELSRENVNHAMDVHAGHMIQMGPRNFLAHTHFSMPISITVEGANILTRNLIIFGQGAIRCHPYILKEVELLSQNDLDVKALDKVLMQHIGFFTSNLLRSLAYGLTGGRLIFACTKNTKMKKLERQLTRMSTALALFADASLILLGGSLKRRERLSARLGDVLSQLYLASAAMKYFSDGDKTPQETYYLMWSVTNSLAKIQQTFGQLAANMPVPFVGTLLKWIIFPYGAVYKRPSDKLHHKIVAEMLANTPLRVKLTQFCFVSKKSDELSARLDYALTHVDENEAYLKKVTKAVKEGIIPGYYFIHERIDAAKEKGILTAQEAQSLVEFEKLRDEIIKVNEFSFDLQNVVA